MDVFTKHALMSNKHIFFALTQDDVCALHTHMDYMDEMHKADCFYFKKISNNVLLNHLIVSDYQGEFSYYQRVYVLYLIKEHEQFREQEKLFNDLCIIFTQQNIKVRKFNITTL